MGQCVPHGERWHYRVPPSPPAQLWHQTGLQPGFEDGSVTSPFDGKRRNQLMPTIPSNEIDPTTALSRFHVITPLAHQGIAIPVGIALIHP